METEEEKTVPTYTYEDSSGYITGNTSKLTNYTYNTGRNTGYANTINIIDPVNTIWNNNSFKLAIHGDINDVKTEEEVETLILKLTEIENKIKARLEEIKGKRVQRRKLNI